MNPKSSKKRRGDQSSKIPPKKIFSQVLEASSSANHDVIIIVDGQRFNCLKEELSQHSVYFRTMFNSNFTEKDKKEVELGGIVESDSFDMFLKVIQGEDVVTDTTVVKMLELADYLESATLETSCIHHLGQKTSYSLQKQFEMAETCHSEKLMVQVCASIKDAYELDEVVPKDLDSFCNSTKNIVMQRSFELLGIRRPAPPPLPEERDQVFEHMLNQIIDQVEVQNHHGEVLKDQVELLFRQMIIGIYYSDTDKTAEKMVREDPLINELLDQLRNAHKQSERNFIQAQIQVLTIKHIYTTASNEELGMNLFLRLQITQDIREKLRVLSAILNRDRQSQIRSQKVTFGDREIDRIYRRITAEATEQNQTARPRNLNTSPDWLQSMNIIQRDLWRVPRYVTPLAQRPRPSFQLIYQFVSSIRNFYYATTPRNELEHNGGGGDGLRN